MADAEVAFGPSHVGARRLLHQYILHGTNSSTMYPCVRIDIFLKSRRRRHHRLRLGVDGATVPVPRVLDEEKRPPGDAEDSKPVRLASANRIGDVSVCGTDMYTLNGRDLRAAPSSIEVQIVSFGLGRAKLSLPKGWSRGRDLVDVPWIVHTYRLSSHLNIHLILSHRRRRRGARLGDRREDLQRLEDKQTRPPVQSCVLHLIIREFWSLPIAHATRSVFGQAMR
mmetsp:Transcript_1939/g.8743  ORF Transcript_1939/g.8743 Transcript_1939/m.8743 type:complete len:225 (+) Transcript_1939:759-1433(+)